MPPKHPPIPHDPEKARAPSVDKTDEWDEFVAKLKEYHEKRGTTFEREPKIGQKRIDLLRLFRRVVDDGGYDHVSDTRASPLQWKIIAAELGYDKATHPSAIAFMLKSVYYKNLAAYEITTIHGKEPPPKDILEDVSAKGGNLLSRTRENFTGVKMEDEVKEDKEDELGSNTRTLRGLRQAPPQRQLFNERKGQSPVPPSYNFGNATAAQALANYEPKPQFPLSLRPVNTPGNNPESYKAQQVAIREARLKLLKNPPPPRSKIMLPGTGFPGPNIYIRTWMALRSPVLDEQEYALHHLVKISHEKGDKYRLDNFSGLAEALIDKLLETTSFFYDLEWKLSYLDDVQSGDVLDALNGTKDLIQKLQTARPKRPTDKIESVEMSRRLKLVNEAGLVVRNMVLLEENAQYLSRYPLIHDTLVILLNLPSDPSVTEIKHYALEIAEQLTKFMKPTLDQPLIATLLSSAHTQDRGAIITSLRAIGKVGTKLDYVTPLLGVPTKLVEQIAGWLLIEDQALQSACLDFLYRYTASIDNVETLLQIVDVDALIRQLVRLLQHGARYECRQDMPQSRNNPQQITSESERLIPKISPDHVDMLLTYDEPERSSQWLRACFEEDPTGEITQIALWQAYQIPFTPFAANRPLLPAKDFITNVSTTFAHASAQVLPTIPQKFVIKGIKPRLVPVDPKGKAFMRCRWDGEGECPEFAQTPAKMWEHVVSSHLGVQKDSDGGFDFANMDGKGRQCRWAGCTRFAKDKEPVSAFTVGMHVKTHLPDSSSMHFQRSKHNVVDAAAKVSSRSWSSATTSFDERYEATGIPLSAVFVLRNLARQIPKTHTAVTAEEAQQVDSDDDTTMTNGNIMHELEGPRKRKRGPEVSYVAGLFSPVVQQMYFVLAHNRSLAEHLATLVRLVDYDA